ncbi:Fur family transcriptional regulator [Bacillus songklensis]|uniref:Fur family transcriptional regulator n=1 Tax=Bacillus songklensis TaxID=1069116 RepID=A0ABV8B5P0_9BACI
MNSLQSLFQFIREKGYLLTDKRKRLIHLLFESHSFLSARQLIIKMQKIYPNISHDTIYRNLNLLVQLGFLETRVKHGEKQFFLVNPIHSDQLYGYFICEQCGSVHPLNLDLNLHMMVNKLEIQHFLFEVYGNCSLCSGGTKSHAL